MRAWGRKSTDHHAIKLELDVFIGRGAVGAVGADVAALRGRVVSKGMSVLVGSIIVRFRLVAHGSNVFGSAPTGLVVRGSRLGEDVLASGGWLHDRGDVMTGDWPAWRNEGRAHGLCG